MGIESFMLTDGVACVVNLKLLRKLCEHCKTIMPPTEAQLTLQRVQALAARGGYIVEHMPTLYEASGCSECRETGFHGRIALHEVLICTPKLIKKILAAESDDEIMRLSVECGMRTLLADGVSKAIAGETTIDEVLRATVGSL